VLDYIINGPRSCKLYQATLILKWRVCIRLCLSVCVLARSSAISAVASHVAYRLVISPIFDVAEYCITDGLMSRLQSVQNGAARLVSGARRYDHITPVLQELHWLPVRRQDGHSGLLVTVRYDSTLPCRRLSASLRRRSSSAAFCQLKDIVSSEGPAAAMETGALLLQVRGCGTVCQLI